MYSLLSKDLGLNTGYNVEVASLWFGLCLQLKQMDSVEHIKEFLGLHGGMKYLKPLYRGLIKLDKSNGHEIFKGHR